MVVQIQWNHYMCDLSKIITRFHDSHVRLTNNQRADMKNRRETNLGRIKKGLADLNKPEVVDTINQGGVCPEDHDPTARGRSGEPIRH